MLKRCSIFQSTVCCHSKTAAKRNHHGGLIIYRVVYMDCYSFIEETAHHDAGRHTYRVPRDLAADEAILCAGKMIAVLNVKFYQALPHAIPGAARPGPLANKPCSAAVPSIQERRAPENQPIVVGAARACVVRTKEVDPDGSREHRLRTKTERVERIAVTTPRVWVAILIPEGIDPVTGAVHDISVAIQALGVV